MASSIKSLVNQNKQSENKDKVEKQARTLIVRRPKDHKIRSSTDIRSAISAKYRNSCIKHTRPCVGGSLLIEFANAEEAENVMVNWDKTLFGGNDGVSKQQPRHTAGLIKQVERLPEQEIIDEIVESYPDARVELFKKQGRFTGTVKVMFKDENSLQQAMENKVRINHQIYMLEIFNPKPRVIKCNKCQAFGHVAKWCDPRNAPVCGKCGIKGHHETKECTVEEADYKCAHCGENHITGSYSCLKMKEKLDSLINRDNGL